MNTVKLALLNHTNEVIYIIDPRHINVRLLWSCQDIWAQVILLSLFPAGNALWPGISPDVAESHGDHDARHAAVGYETGGGGKGTQLFSQNELRPLSSSGAILLRTGTELIIKSRRVVPARLMREGFTFDFPTLESAITSLEARRRDTRSRTVEI